MKIIRGILLIALGLSLSCSTAWKERDYATLDDNKQKLAECFVGEEFDPQGEIALRWTIKPLGDVDEDSMDIVKNTMKNESLGYCLKGAISEVEFLPSSQREERSFYYIIR